MLLRLSRLSGRKQATTARIQLKQESDSKRTFDTLPDYIVAHKLRTALDNQSCNVTIHHVDRATPLW